jgi:hypothetical protein
MALQRTDSGLHPVGADHIATGLVDYQEMLTDFVKDIGIDTRGGRFRQTNSHFPIENSEPQTLCRASVCPVGRESHIITEIVQQDGKHRKSYYYQPVRALCLNQKMTS